jgi:hypothetical protein
MRHRTLGGTGIEASVTMMFGAVGNWLPFATRDDLAHVFGPDSSNLHRPRRQRNLGDGGGWPDRNQRASLPGFANDGGGGGSAFSNCQEATN